MGCSASDAMLSNSSERNFVELMVSGETQLIINKIEDLGPLFKANTPINFKGDTLLHYACFKGNKTLIKYLKKRPDYLCTIKNKVGETPRNLTNDETVIKLIE